MRYDWPHSIFNFDPIDGPDRDNCFLGTVTTEQPDTLRILDAIPDRGHVAIRLQPLTPKRNGKPTYGRLYVRHPRITPTRVEATAGGLYLEIRTPTALAALKRIGCAATVVT